MRSPVLSLAAAGLALCVALTMLCSCKLDLSNAAARHDGGRPVAQPVIFTDELPRSGIDFSIHQTRSPITIKESVGHGVAMIDYDGDGLPDLVFLGPDMVKVYHNDGHWHFTDVTSRMHIRQKGYWQGVAVGDYDNDGYPDLYVCGYNCSALYHNEHGHGFKEVTQEAGLQISPPDAAGNPDWRTSAAFVDVDQDGLLDLYVCRYAKFGPKTSQLCKAGGDALVSCAPEMYTAEKGSLFMNLGHGRFRDETERRGLDAASGRGLGIAVADYNSDGWIDIALANDEVPGNLFENKGHGYFVDRSAMSGTAYDSGGKTHGGMGIDWGDIDNTGLLDLFVTTYEDEPKNLYKNMQRGVFLDISHDAGGLQSTLPWVGWGAKFVDYDGDGLLDLFTTSGHVMDNAHVLGKAKQYAQPIQLFHNIGNDKFVDVSGNAGPAFQHNLVGRAACVGDLDNEGRQDIVVSNIEGRPLLLHNVCPSANHWLGLQLVGTRSNRMGLGSEVRVKAGGLRLLRLCTTTGSVLSAHDPRVYCGLGPNATAQRVTIRWPSGKIDTFADVPADRYWIATEGRPNLSAIPYGKNAVPAQNMTSKH